MTPTQAELERMALARADVVIIDVGDWAEETELAGLRFLDVRDAYEKGAAGHLSAKKLSRLYFMRQKQGDVEELVFDPTGKTEFAEGVYRVFIRESPMEALMGRDADGHEVIVGYAKSFPNAPQKQLVDGSSADGTQAALNYLFGACMGHIKQCVVRLGLNGEDVERIWQEFVKLSGAMVAPIVDAA